MSSNLPPRAVDFLDSWLDYRYRQLDIPGFCVAVYDHDEIIFSKAYGLSNPSLDTALTTRHLFSMASQSKMFTATAIMQLAERGHLQLDDPASAYLPWMKEHRDTRFQEITIRQLLSHSAGLIRDGLEVDFWRLEKPFPSKDWIKKTLLTVEVIMEPNTELKYSNLGFALLGQVIEAASGLAYADYINTNIIQPLSLHDTFVDYTQAIADRVSPGYGVPYEHWRPPLGRRTSTHGLISAIGIHATTEDICRFSSAHFFGNTKLLSDRSKKEMQRSQWAVRDGYDIGMEAGLGLDIQYIGERRVVGHTGHLAGHLSATFFDPHNHFVVSVVANAKDAPSTQIVRGVFEALDWFRTNQATSRKSLDRYAGRFCNTTVTIEIVTAGQSVVAISPDDWEPFTWYEELEFIGSDTFRIITPGSVLNHGEIIDYSIAKNGAIQSLRYSGATLLPEKVYRQKIRKRKTGFKNKR